MAILHHRFPGICIGWFIASSSLGTYCARLIYRFFLPCQKRWDRTCGANHFLHLIRWMSATKCCTRLDIKGDSNLHWMCGILPEFLDSNHFRVCLFKWLGFHVQFAWNSLPTMSTGRWICQICVLPLGDAWNYGLAGFAVSEDNDCHWLIDHHSKEMKHACAMVASIGESLAYPCIYNLHSCSLTNAPGRFDLFPFCALKMHEAPAKIHDIFRHAPSL